jgi:hypothetical protein
MNFLISFLCYLAAFGAGAGLTWLIVRVAVNAQDPDQALAHIRSANSTKAVE